MKLIDMLVEDGLNGWKWPNGHADVTVKRYDAIADDWAAAIITREQYEAALAAKNEDWIEWGGGECPVPLGTLVDVKYLCGDVNRHIKAGEPDSSGSIDTAFAVRWSKLGAEYDIIAYRLHKPQETEQAEADDEADLNECIGQDAAPVWNGEGLPPVGCECEVSVDGGRSWCTYRAINEKNGARLIEIGNFTEEFQNNNWIFRPIRSEEERKRDIAIQSMNSVWRDIAGKEVNGKLLSIYEVIYDTIAAGKIPGMKLED